MKCQIRWCGSGNNNLVPPGENIGDGSFIVWICQDCFTMFGWELPHSIEVQRKCKERYGS